MKLLKLLFLVSISIYSVGCNIESSTSSDNSDSTTAPEDEKVKNLEEALNKTKDAFSDLLSDGNEDGETAEVVNWRDLRDFLPNKMAGLSLDEENVEGQTTKMLGFEISNVEVNYKKNDSQLDVKVLDFAGVGFLLNSVASFANAEIDSDTSDGYQRTTEYEGYKAFEEFNEKRQSGSFSVLVEKRFVVTVSGRNIEMDDLKDAIDDLNIKKLARMAT